MILTCLLLFEVYSAKTNLNRRQESVLQATGVTTDLLGNRLSDVKVIIKSKQGEVKTITKSDNFGKFEIKGLPTGIYEISATYSGFLIKKSQIALSNDRVVCVYLSLINGDLTQMPSKAIYRQVRSVTDKPLAYASVSVNGADDNDVKSTVFTDEEGKFRIDMPHPGQYVVYAALPSYTTSAKIIVAQGAAVEVNYRCDFILEGPSEF
jgi:uncharacterized surface anchored protein